MIKLTEPESILTWMVPDMKDNGVKINNMEWVVKNGLMVLTMKEIIILEKNTVKENSIGQMEVIMMEISNKIIFTDKEYMNGLMVENIKDNGKIIRCTAKVTLLGQMEENMKEIM